MTAVEARDALPGDALQEAIEARLEQLRAALEILRRVAIDPSVVPPIEKMVADATGRYLLLPDPDDRGFAAAAAALEGECRRAHRAVLEADLTVPVGTFKRTLEPGTLEPRTLAAYARLVASSPLEDRERRQRFEFAVTHALCERRPDHRLTLRPATEREPLLRVIAEGASVPPERRQEIGAFLRDARERLGGFADTAEMFDDGFDLEVRRWRDSLGPGLKDPAVLEEIVEFEVAFRDKALSIPASDHPMSQPPPAGSKAPPAPPAFSSPEEDARDRVQAVADVLAMARELITSSQQLALIREALELCQGRLEALGEVESEGYLDRLGELEEGLARAELTAHRVESAIDMIVFRDWVERTGPEEARLRRHARFLTRHVLADVQRDRFEFLATRLLGTQDDEGRARMMSRDAAAPILEAILAERTNVARHRIADAVLFFRDATLQLATLTSLDDVFQGGFYLDVRGYKVAIGQDLLHPDLLYAVVAFNVAVQRRLEEMRLDETRSRRSLYKLIGESKGEIREAFGEEGATEDDRFEEARRYLQRHRKNLEVEGERPRDDFKVIGRGVFALLLLALFIAGVGSLFFRDENHIVQMSPEELEWLCPALEEGGVSRGSDEPTFIGRVSTERWMVLRPEEREENARLVLERLEAQGVRAAWITRGRHPVINIANGAIVSVD
jgi:hypothetical protein